MKAVSDEPNPKSERRTRGAERGGNAEGPSVGRSRVAVSRAKKRKPGLRNGQLMRALRILIDLERLGGIDLYELAERHGTTVRTIRRDLQALEEAGVPLREEADGKRKRWHVGYKEHRNQVASLLDAGHYLALRLALGQGSAARNLTGIFASLEDLAEKIQGALGARGREQLEAIEACFYSYEKFAYQKSPPDVLWPLVHAITDRKLCRVTYRPPHAATDKVLECLPLRLFTHDGAVYVMAHVSGNRGDEGVRTLHLHRVRDLKVLAKVGTPPEDFDPQTVENLAFGIWSGGKLTTYRLRFDAAVTPYIRERVWHPSQSLRDLGDGSLEVAFTCGASLEVTAWVASWREHVEVVEPAPLREELGELGTWLAETYGSKGARRA